MTVDQKAHHFRCLLWSELFLLVSSGYAAVLPVPTEVLQGTRTKWPWPAQVPPTTVEFFGGAFRRHLSHSDVAAEIADWAWHHTSTSASSAGIASISYGIAWCTSTFGCASGGQPRLRGAHLFGTLAHLLIVSGILRLRQALQLQQIPKWTRRVLILLPPEA